MDLTNLKPHLIGGGRVDFDSAGALRLSIPPVEGGYADAQVDDYQGVARSAFPWAPPLKMQLRARASDPAPLGTLGFGFWNDPFGISLSGAGSVRRLPAAPQSIWFFYGSPPNDFTFAEDGVGSGWKAATLRSIRYPALVMLPGAAAAFLLGNLPLIRKLVVPQIMRQAAATEITIDAPLDEWHEYTIVWEIGQAEFWVDGSVVASSTTVPHSPLGFVVWIDNQYAVLSAEKGVRFGLLQTKTESWLEIADLRVEQMPN